MKNDNPLRRTRAPNKSGSKPILPKSKPGRAMNACKVGPWAMLLAMHRVQNGEPCKYVCAELGISVNTMNTWQERWGGDVVHFRPQIQEEFVQRSMAKLVAIKRLITMHLKELTLLQDQMTGENGLFRVMRDAAKQITPSELPAAWGSGPQFIKPPARKRQVKGKG